MTVLPSPTKETYTDFLKRKLRGRNVSPEFRQRYPALFDSIQQTTPAPVANWETYYRQAKPTTTVQNNNDDQGLLPSPLNNIPYTPSGIYYAPDGTVHIDTPKAYRDSLLADIQNAPRDIVRGVERGFNELTTGLPDVRSNESILAEIDANREARSRAGLPAWSGAGLFDITDTLMKDEFDNLEKWGWGPGITPVKGSDYVDTLERGLFSGLGSFGEKLSGAIQEEIVNPIKSGVDEFTSFVKDPSQYVEDKWNSMSAEDVVPKGAGVLGKLGATFLGLGQAPATIAGYGIGKIAEMMMSEGGGQIGMPGQVEHSIPITHADGTKGWSTTYSPDVISHFNSDGIAVNKDGDPVLTPGPMHSPTSGHYQYGTPTKIDNTGTPESDDDGYGGFDSPSEDPGDDEYGGGGGEDMF